MVGRDLTGLLDGSLFPRLFGWPAVVGGLSGVSLSLGWDLG